MRIAISGYFLLHPNTGTGQYTAALIRSVGKVCQDEICVICPRPVARVARSLLDGRDGPWRVLPLSVRFPGDLGKLWFEQVGVVRASRRLRAGLLHVPYLGPPLIRPCRTVVTIHDLIMLLFPETRRSPQARAYTWLAARSAKGADFVLADSASTRDDVVRILRIPPEKISVAHLASDETLGPVKDERHLEGIRRKYGLEPGFVFYIGGLDWRKNLPRLLRAFASLPLKPQLAIAGRAFSQRSDSFPDLEGLAESLGIQDRVVFLGQVPDEDKALLYSGCAAFVFPSLYEGFGLTPLEAMSCGAPVVCSRASSLPEVVGDAALLFDPEEEGEISAALARVLADAGLRTELSRKGLEQAGRFSWQGTAEKTLEAYRDAVRGSACDGSIHSGRSGAGKPRLSMQFDGTDGLLLGRPSPPTVLSEEGSTNPPRIWGNEGLSRWNTVVRRGRQEVRDRTGRVLEVGCGAGRFMRSMMPGNPCASFFGCDLDLRSLAAGHRQRDGAKYSAADVHALPYQDGRFQTVLVFDVLEHLTQPARAMDELRRVLEPGGMLHALVPCEGQPGSLHWLLWRLRLGADLKERHCGHVQRFTRKSALKLFDNAGFVVDRVTYSMHPVGQLRDILSYVGQEDWLRRKRLLGTLMSVLVRLLWAGAYVESNLLFKNVAAGAVAMHVTARKGDGS